MSKSAEYRVVSIFFMKKNFHFSNADSQVFSGMGKNFSKKVFEKFGG